MVSWAPLCYRNLTGDGAGFFMGFFTYGGLQKMENRMNKCPHPTCGRSKPIQNYACRQHWFSLTKVLRDAIWAGYRAGNILKPDSKWAKADKACVGYWKEKGIK